MENDLLRQIHPLLNSLIEEKHRIQSEIQILNKSIESRDSQINTLATLVSELNTTSKIRADQVSLATKLNQPQPSHEFLIQTPEIRKEKLKKCQKVLKQHRQSLAKMAQSIQDELDVFQVCFLADIETFQSKIPKKQVRGKVFAEVIHLGVEESEDLESDLKAIRYEKKLDVESERIEEEGKGINKGSEEERVMRDHEEVDRNEGTEDKDEKNKEIEIGRIQFAGIQKKNSKRGKKK